MVKSCSVKLDLSVSSHQYKQLDVVKCSTAPQLRNPIRTQRSGEAVKNLTYLMTSSFDAAVGGVNDRGLLE